MAKESYLDKARKATETQDEDDESEGDSTDDYETFETVKVTPTTVTSGIVEDIWFAGDITAEEQSGDFGIRLRDPQVESGTIIKSSEDGSSSAYKVIDEENPDTEVHEDLGVETQNSSLYKGEMVDEFEEDALDFYFGGGTANEYLARFLDVNGEPGAGVRDDGSRTNGLMEYPEGHNDPEQDTPSPRVARVPQVRSDIEGDRIEIIHARADDIDEDYEVPDDSNGVAYRVVVLGEDGEPLDMRRAEDEVPDDVFQNLAWSDGPVEDASNVTTAVATGEDASEFTDQQQKVITDTVAYLEENSLTIDAFEDGLDGHIEDNLDDVSEGDKQAIAGEIRSRLRQDS